MDGEGIGLWIQARLFSEGLIPTQEVSSYALPAFSLLQSESFRFAHLGASAEKRW